MGWGLYRGGTEWDGWWRGNRVTRPHSGATGVTMCGPGAAIDSSSICLEVTGASHGVRQYVRIISLPLPPGSTRGPNSLEAILHGIVCYSDEGW